MNAETQAELLLQKILKKESVFQNHVFAVGGYVRDQVMGIESKDLDVVLDIESGAQQFSSFLKETFGDAVTTPYKMGESYPIWQITFTKDVKIVNDILHCEGAVIEISETHTEHFPDDQSRQRTISFGTLDQDICRRDFTTNMLAKNLTSGEIVDLSGVGISDIKAGILRGHPRMSLSEAFRSDPLRMIRLIRFHVKYGWTVPEDVKNDIKNNVKRISIVSAERIREELVKIMKLGKMAEAVLFMDEVGLLGLILPEVAVLKDTPQTEKYHAESTNVLGHVVEVLKNSKPTVEHQLGALLHDVGKAVTITHNGDDINYYLHELKGVTIAEQTLRRLKFDKDTIDLVKMLVENHMRPCHLPDASEKAIRKLIREIPEPGLSILLDVSEADEKGSWGKEIVRDRVPELRNKIEEIRNAPIPVIVKPILDGNEVMTLLNIKPSKKIKEIHEFLLNLEDDLASTGKALTKEEASKLVLEKFTS